MAMTSGMMSMYICICITSVSTNLHMRPATLNIMGNFPTGKVVKDTMKGRSGCPLYDAAW